MKAVAIGSYCHSDKYNDIDIIADTEFVQASFRNDIPYYTNNNVSGSVSAYKIDNIIYEVTVPNSGTAYESILRDYGAYSTIKDLKKAPIEVLLALKKAHLILPHKWLHHIKSYKVLKDSLGCDAFDPTYYGVGDIFNLHRKECLSVAKKHPKLNTQKTDFFKTEEEYNIYDHDSIHRAVALDGEPAYTLMQDGEVWCSKSKWNNMTDRQRLNCVIEETCVLALERSIIPSMVLGNTCIGSVNAYNYALFKISTTISSGFFRDYCIEVHDKALAQRPDYTTAFFKGLTNKIVTPYVAKAY